ncbi:MAG: carboxypeptidase-like regulatory domain-containing protein [Planctomycetes bacterium]|nr:carboxypeptidase-like regulatory domain-containing protein [Planctomycetota bacterium]
MRILQGLVALQAIVLAVLFTKWCQQPDAPPPPATAAGLVAANTPGATTEASSPHAGPSTTPAPLDRERLAVATSSIVLQGLLVGVDPLPDDDDVNLACRRDGIWRPAKVSRGRFAIAGLSPGRWQLRCESRGCRLLQLDVVLDHEPVQRRDLALSRAVVLPVFVRTSQDRRLQTEIGKLGIWQSLQVIATEQELRSDLAPTENSSVGDLGVGRHRRSTDLNQRNDPNGDDGVLELDRDPPVFASLLLRHVLLASQRIEPGQSELRFVVDVEAATAKLAKVRLRVVDAAGQPVAKARIGLSSAQGGGAHALTTDDGTATLEHVLPGLCHFEVGAKDTENYASHLTLAPAAEIDLGDVVLHAASKLVGRVVDEHGQGVSCSLQWTALDLWQPPHPLQDRRNAAADGDGKFELWGTGAGRRYLVRAKTQGQRGERGTRVGFAHLDASATPPAEPPTIVLHEASMLQLRVREPGLTTFAVVVRDRDERPIEVRVIEPRWRESSVLLPEGEYVLDVYDGAGTRLSHRPLLVGTEPTTVELP